ncbi:HU family DNA-binding protein [Desulfomonile tiedjei]|uniref:Bacterial nucleoid DNA-binding protein n=1 Tax=Desulfomonile tiedjei (strain ATCC 49306 / DSM 6799 / DCB-1) TaxID=706587 RepID=I4CCH5_DESTA|nr:HU family DNA-binding protein [Desulfomonile tiedjei]AFM27266.1 bacterial nucleoid DNA-binding protein [Desulfomonile tiedjei DSM 6799]
MREIIEVVPIDDYRLEIGFGDGERTIVDMKPLMKRKSFQPLMDKALFSQVEIDRKFGGVQWPNGIDVCTDWIEAQSKSYETRNLTRAELISQISNKTKVSKKAVDQVLKSLVGTIRRTLEENREIRIPELGTFSVVQRTGRTIVDFRTGIKIKILPTKAPRFRASKSLKDSIKKSK